MNRYSSYTCEYRPSEINELHISHDIRKILRQDYEVLNRISGYNRRLGESSIEENYEDEITKAFDYLEDVFDYNYETDYGDY